MSEAPTPPAPAPDDPEAQAARAEERRQSARLMTYRLVPLWVGLLVFGITLVWEVAVRGNAITEDKLKAAGLISLAIALFVGAPLGIRYFNPLPPKK